MPVPRDTAPHETPRARPREGRLGNWWYRNGTIHWYWSDGGSRCGLAKRKNGPPASPAEAPDDVCRGCWHYRMIDYWDEPRPLPKKVTR